jgi:hypothetical protein
MYRITLKPKEEAITLEQIKLQLKKNNNPTGIKVGIKAVKTIRDRGILLKIGWEICNVADYLVPTRCYKCSTYNHKNYECKGEETCPHCAGKHKMKDCTTVASEQKCITYNRLTRMER